MQQIIIQVVTIRDPDPIIFEWNIVNLHPMVPLEFLDVSNIALPTND